MLINVIGLPKDGDAKLFHDVYKACDKGTMFDTGVAEKVLEGYECKLIPCSVTQLGA